MKSNILPTIGEFRSPRLREGANADTEPNVNTHVLLSTRIEKMIYGDLREQIKMGLDETEIVGTAKLNTFPSLVQDAFMSLYSLNPRHNDIDTLTANVRHFNVPLLDFIMGGDHYAALKTLCEGRDLIAYEAVNELAQHLLAELHALHDADALEELDTLKRQQSELKAEVSNTMERSDPADEDSIFVTTGRIENNEQEIERLSRKISRNIRQNKDAVQAAVTSAVDRAQEASDVIKSWGNGDSSPAAMQQNIELLRQVQSSQKLRDIIKYLGKYREIFDNARKSSYIYGRGDKYDIVLGNDFTRAISSEYAYLALPETIPIFIQKVQRKTLKQYRKRECVTRDHGDIVVCIDESGSMEGDSIAWAKAVALVLLEHAIQNNRSCAMVRFASSPETVTHVFTKGKYSQNDVFDFAESFLGGGTNFEIPLNKAVTLIETEGFENADIMFISDGQCCISEDFAEDFCYKIKQLKFSVTGIVIGSGKADADFSLAPFCKKVYRLGRMTGDNIALDIITSFVM